MKLRKLNISNFGLFHNKEIELSPGLNLIYGKNEAGKSTIHSFIKGMLFGIEKTRGRPSVNDMYDKYQPWNIPGSYDGSLEFEVDNNTYHIYRNFDKNNKEMILTDVKTGRDLKLSQIEIEELIRGLTKSGYDGTVSIGQLASKTEDELIYVVQNHITNLTMTKSEEIDVKRALESLKEKHKQYDLKSLKREIGRLEKRIREGEIGEQQINDLTKQLSDIQIEEERLIKEKDKIINNKYFSQDEIHRHFMNFPVIKTKYGYYLDRLEERGQLEEKIELVQEKIDGIQKNGQNKNLVNDSQIEKVGENLESINSFKEEYSQLSKEKYEYKSQIEDELELGRRSNLNISSPLFVFGLVLYLTTYNKNDFFAKVGISLAVIGVIVFIALRLLHKNKETNFKIEYDILDEEIVKLKQNIHNILYKYNVESEYELKAMYEESQKEQILLNQLANELRDHNNEYSLLNEKIKSLKNEISEYIKLFSFIYPEELKYNLELKDDIIGILDEYITDESLKINYYEEKIKPKLIDLSIKRERIKWEIELLEGKEEELLENQEKYEELLYKQEMYEVEIASINLATTTIAELAIDIHDTFGAELNKIASDLAKGITGGNYKEIKIDEKLKIRTKVKDQYQYLERLSTGTIDQLYFSLRLAIADLVYGKSKAPILLDDTFAYYDDQRLESTLEFLSNDKERQILLFTCHNREKEILDTLDVDYNYIEL